MNLNNIKIFACIVISTTGLVGFVITKTNSQIYKSRALARVAQYKPVLKRIPLKPMLDTLKSEVDTIKELQSDTKERLENTGDILDVDYARHRELNNFLKHNTSTKDTTVIIKHDTVVIEKTLKPIVIVDTVEVKESFFKKIFKFLPFKKKRE